MNISYTQEGTQGHISMLQTDLTTAELQSREGREKLPTIEHLLYADTVPSASTQVMSCALKHKQSTDLKPEKDVELCVMLMPLAPP